MLFVTEKKKGKEKRKRHRNRNRERMREGGGGESESNIKIIRNHINYVQISGYEYVLRCYVAVSS